VHIIAIALSGGKSLRMGQDKALLEINGETLLFKTCQTALEVAESVYIVARSQEQYHQAIAPNPDPIYLVIDQQFAGALVGFWQGIQAINDPVDWLLLLACDLPNLRHQNIQVWANQLADLPEKAIAYLPRYTDENSQKQWEPLCGFYHWRCRDSLELFIKNGGRSFQKWLKDQSVIEIENAPPSMLFNCNTPNDLSLFTSLSRITVALFLN
jgi:molybdopterin-guanine dinucleotide biosynthesis protein A